MMPSECVKLVAYLAARCPAMRMEEATPDVWYDDLKNIRYVDAQEAIKDLSSKQRYVSLDEIVKSVRAMRNRRIELVVLPAPPDEIADDPAATARWTLEMRHRVADGWTPDEAPGLSSRNVKALISSAFRARP